MTDRPTLFSGPMVRALLDGSKTQTRRVLTGGRMSLFNGQWSDSYVLDPGNASWRQHDVRLAAGDRLWVREAWRTGAAFDKSPPRDIPNIVHIACEADDDRASLSGKLRPGMFMPRWASRLTLPVTEVRVQRLQDISEADAIAEGIEKDHAAGMPSVWGWHDYLRGDDIAKRHFADPRDSYRTLWDSLNGKRPGFAWSDNPWVVAVTFTVHRANIDAMPAEAS